MKSISKLHEKCEKCPYVDVCDEKRKVACGMLPLPERMLDSASAAMTMPVSAGMLVKHDYRDIKISPTQSITIDLEKMKKDLEQRIYKAFCYPGFEFGA